MVTFFFYKTVSINVLTFIAKMKISIQDGQNKVASVIENPKKRSAALCNAKLIYLATTCILQAVTVTQLWCKSRRKVANLLYNN